MVVINTEYNISVVFFFKKNSCRTIIECVLSNEYVQIWKAILKGLDGAIPYLAIHYVRTRSFGAMTHGMLNIHHDTSFTSAILYTHFGFSFMQIMYLLKLLLM